MHHGRTMRPASVLLASCTLLAGGVVLPAPGAAGASPSPAPPSAGAPGATPCTGSLPAGSHELSLVAGGIDREVIIHVPPGPSVRRRPAAIGFHGYTATAAQLEATSGLSAEADSGDFVVAYVQGAGDPPGWTFPGHLGAGAADLELVAALLDRLLTDACADPGRIVLFGHSMGGGMASAAACALADRVAGVVLASAFWVALPCEPSRAVPVVMMHALDDPVLPYGGGTVGGGGPRVLPVEDAAAAWADRDGCTGDPTESLDPDGVLEVAWAGCAAPVTLVRLPSGGHDWAAGATARIVAMLADG